MHYFNPLSGNSSGVEISVAANICLGIEIFFLIFHLIIPGYYIFLAYAKNIVHINLQLIVCSAVGSSYVYAPIRTIMILCERDYIEDGQEKIYMVTTIIRTWYHSSLLFTQLAAFVERLFASLIIESYEKSKYLHISVLLILMVNIISFSLSLFLFFDIVNYPQVLFFMVAAETTALPSLVAIYKLNDKAKKRFTTERARYSLSMRFQLHENFRLMKTTLNLILATIVCVFLVVIVIFVNVYNKEESFRQIGAGLFDIVMTLIPLVFWTTVILSYPELRTHFFRLLGVKKCSTKVEVVTNASDPTIYFQMLEMSWR